MGSAALSKAVRAFARTDEGASTTLTELKEKWAKQEQKTISRKKAVQVANKRKTAAALKRNKVIYLRYLELLRFNQSNDKITADRVIKEFCLASKSALNYILGVGLAHKWYKELEQ